MFKGLPAVFLSTPYAFIYICLSFDPDMCISTFEIYNRVYDQNIIFITMRASFATIFAIMCVAGSLVHARELPGTSAGITFVNDCKQKVWVYRRVATVVRGYGDTARSFDCEPIPMSKVTVGIVLPPGGKRVVPAWAPGNDHELHVTVKTLTPREQDDWDITAQVTLNNKRVPTTTIQEWGSDFHNRLDDTCFNMDSDIFRVHTAQVVANEYHIACNAA